MEKEVKGYRRRKRENKAEGRIVEDEGRTKRG
jgi:hypothetical protein